MGAFPSGQRGQTVNLLSSTSVVRIHPLPPHINRHTARYGGLYLVGVALIRPPAPGAVWSNPRSVKKMCLRHIFSAGLAAMPQGGRHHRQGHRYGGLSLYRDAPGPGTFVSDAPLCMVFLISHLLSISFLHRTFVSVRCYISTLVLLCQDLILEFLLTF